MLGSLVRLVLYRFLGARVMLAIAAFGLLRRLLGGKRDDSTTTRVRSDSRLASARGRAGDPPGSGQRSGYQPSQGASQTVQREPR